MEWQNPGPPLGFARLEENLISKLAETERAGVSCEQTSTTAPGVCVRRGELTSYPHTLTLLHLTPSRLHTHAL